MLRAVLAARVGWESEDDEHERRATVQERLTAQIMRALDGAGLSLATYPEDIEFDEPPTATATHHGAGENPPPAGT